MDLLLFQPGREKFGAINSKVFYVTQEVNDISLGVDAKTELEHILVLFFGDVADKCVV
jgi:hypothetical protein